MNKHLSDDEDVSFKRQHILSSEPSDDYQDHWDQWRVSCSIPPPVIISGWSLIFSQFLSELHIGLFIVVSAPRGFCSCSPPSLPPAGLRTLRLPSLCHAVSVGEQLDEVWTGGSGLSGLECWTIGSPLHWPPDSCEFQLFSFLLKPSNPGNFPTNSKY